MDKESFKKAFKTAVIHHGSFTDDEFTAVIINAAQIEQAAEWMYRELHGEE